jgi:hypothetical protein
MKRKRGDYFKWNTVGRKSLQVEHCGPEIPEFFKGKVSKLHTRNYKGQTVSKITEIFPSFYRF